MLCRVEEELACCKVDNMEIDTRFNEIAEDKLQLELNLQALFNEAEEAKKVCQRREAERSVVKASFEEARSELRQSGNMLFLFYCQQEGLKLRQPFGQSLQLATLFRMLMTSQLLESWLTPAHDKSAVGESVNTGSCLRQKPSFAFF
ncbi:hypothetical protein RHGRI_031094 [Rhododendron griersonianum]|uniref:Uncharacterized protein n=1 Tax=Rhododendron griersonianum TaxID=479676 RepID=A0AAV6I6H7_9ERIC|nr:hypothetical protein RHGRI_031094 [Rhododendron griersonianum]